MALKKSKVKLDEDGFNDMPPRNVVIESLNTHKYDVVDVDGVDATYWQNENDFSEEDLYELQNGEVFNWTFTADDGQDIGVELYKGDEEENK